MCAGRRGRLRRHELDCALARSEAGVAAAGCEQVVAEALVQERGAHRIGVADERDGSPAEFNGARRGVGLKGPLRRPRRELDEVEARDRGCVRHGGPQSERPFEVRQSLRQTEDRLRLARGLDRRDERLSGPPRRFPMRCELRRRGRRFAARELGGEPRVQLLALAGKQRFVDRLGQQRVAEAKAARRLIGDEHAMIDGRAQTLAHGELGQRGRVAQQPVVHFAPCGSGQLSRPCVRRSSRATRCSSRSRRLRGSSLPVPRRLRGAPRRRRGCPPSGRRWRPPLIAAAAHHGEP